MGQGVAAVGVDTRVEVETVVGVDRGAGMEGIENGGKIWVAATLGAVTGEGDICISIWGKQVLD